ncbi:MAG: SpoIIE family protein phosphatase [Spirochaetes bacterium]|nr:SpoIIE family protein phosphatase [Spirochaetota bacterium]
MKKIFSLKYQFSLYVIILISIMTASIVLFVRFQEKKALTDEMKLRGEALIKTLAGNVQEIFLTVGSSDLISLSSLVDQIKREKGVFDIWIAKKDGSLIIHSKPEIQKKIDEQAIRGKIFSFKDDVFEHAVKSTTDRIMTLVNVKANSYQISQALMVRGKKLGIVGLNLSKQFIDETVGAAVGKLLLIAFGSIVLGILCTYLLVSVVVHPVHRLAEGASIIGQGDLDHKIEIKSKNEIGLLAWEFNKMTDDLKKAQKNLIEKERMEKEIQIARNIQKSLLPKSVPRIKNYSFGALYRSAKEVSGDYYDFIRVDPEHLGIIVADVSGKGVPAAVIMAITRSIIRSYAPGHLSPYEVFTMVNYLVHQNIYKGMYVTAFYGILNINKNNLTFVKAGHNFLVVYRNKSQKCEIVHTKGTALGLPVSDMFKKMLEEKTVDLNKGDIIFQYSDGISEAINEKGELYTNERLYENITKFAHLDAQGLVNKIDESVSEWIGNHPQSDDITMIAIKIE